MIYTIHYMDSVAPIHKHFANDLDAIQYGRNNSNVRWIYWDKNLIYSN